MKYIVHIGAAGLNNTERDVCLEDIKKKFKEADFFEPGDKVVYLFDSSATNTRVETLPDGCSKDNCCIQS